MTGDRDCSTTASLKSKKCQASSMPGNFSIQGPAHAEDKVILFEHCDKFFLFIDNEEWKLNPIALHFCVRGNVEADISLPRGMFRNEQFGGKFSPVAIHIQLPGGHILSSPLCI